VISAVKVGSAVVCRFETLWAVTVSVAGSTVIVTGDDVAARWFVDCAIEAVTTHAPTPVVATFAPVTVQGPETRA
jgi:hypothetical protein